MDEQKQTTVVLQIPVYVGGQVAPAGTTVTIADELAEAWIADGIAKEK